MPCLVSVRLHKSYITALEQVVDMAMRLAWLDTRGGVQYVQVQCWSSIFWLPVKDLGQSGLVKNEVAGAV